MSSENHIKFADGKSRIIFKEKDFTRILFLNSDLLASAPHPPSNLAVAGFTDNTVDLTWSAPSIGTFDDYTVYVTNQTTGLQEQVITEIGLESTTVFGLTEGDTYAFYVVSVRDGIESAPSNTVNETPNIAPDPVTNLVSVPGETIIDITWTDSVSTDVAYISVLLDDVEVSQVTEGVEAYQYTGLTTGITYKVSLIVYDDAGNPSTEVFDNVTPFSVVVNPNLTFDGVDQYSNLGQLNDFDGAVLAAHTIEYWFRNTNTDANDVYGAYQNSIAGGDVFGQLIFARLNENSNGGYQAGSYSFQLRPDQSGSFNVTALQGYVPSLPLNDGEWHHVALVCDKANGTASFYFDGEPKTVIYENNGTQTDFIDWHVDFALGGFNINRGGGGGIDIIANPFDGEIEEFRMWSELRTEQQINDNLYKEIVDPSSEANLVHYYKMNEGSGNTIADSKGTKDGTLVNNIADNMWFSKPIAPTNLTVDAKTAFTLTVSANPSGADSYNAIINGILIESGVTEAALVAGYKFEGLAPDTTHEVQFEAVTGGVKSLPSIILFEATAINYLYQFDGTNDYIETSTFGNFGSNLGAGITMEAWVKTTSTQRMVVAGSFNDGNATYLTLEVNINEQLNNLAGYVYFSLRDENNVFRIVSSASSVNINDGNLHHIAGTYDGSTTKIFVDGVEVSVQVRSGSGAPSNFGNFTYPIWIGNRNAPSFGNLWYTGEIDEVRIWNAVRTPTEIANNYNTDLDPGSTGLLAYYKFDSETGGVTPDETTNNNDASVNGATLIVDTNTTRF